MVQTRVFQDDTLALVIGTGGPLDPATTYAGLYIAGPTATPPVTTLDFTLPNAVGTPAQKITTWSAIHYLADGRSAADSPALCFSTDKAENGYMAIGWYMASKVTGGDVLDYGLLDAPVNIVDQHSTVTIIIRECCPITKDWGAHAFIDG
jgi:hypothetical protein